MSRRKHTGVFQAPNGLFGVDYRTPDGHRHHYIVGSEKEAINEHRKQKTEIYEGRYRPPRRERKTFSEVMREYLECQRGMVSDATLYNNQLRAQHLEPMLGHELVDRIDAYMLVRILATIKNRKPLNSIANVTSGATANRYRALLSGLFGFALAAKYVDVNPVSGKTVKKYPEPKGRVRYLTADEELAIRRAIRQMCCCRDTYRELEFDLALFTGLRKGEQYRAKWAKVDLLNRLMTVLGKSRGQVVERTIPLNPMALDTLQKLYEVSAGSSYVIPVRKVAWARFDREGQKDERGWFDQAVDAAGVEDFSWHDLRHTFASRAVMAGVPLRTVMEWMGHQSIRTTMIYAHLSPNHHQMEMQKIVDTRKDSSGFVVTQIDESKAV